MSQCIPERSIKVQISNAIFILLPREIRRALYQSASGHSVASNESIDLYRTLRHSHIMQTFDKHKVEELGLG